MKTTKFDLFKTRYSEQSRSIEFANIGHGQTIDNKTTDEMTFQQWVEFINYVISVVNESVENSEVKDYNGFLITKTKRNTFTIFYTKNDCCYKCGPVAPKVFLNWFSVQYDELVEMLEIQTPDDEK